MPDRTAATGPQVVYLIRHGEKPDDAGDASPGLRRVAVSDGGSGGGSAGGSGAAGVDALGRPDPHALTPRGWQRAGALAALFGPTPASRQGSAPRSGPPAGLSTPTRLVAPDYGTPEESVRHRPHQTLVPLAARLGLGIGTPAAKTDPAGLARQVCSEPDGCTLICWDHENIPAVVAAIAAIAPVDEAPAGGWQWPGARFDIVLAFTRVPDPDGGLRYQLAQLPQLLLGGDSADRLPWT